MCVCVCALIRERSIKECIKEKREENFRKEGGWGASRVKGCGVGAMQAVPWIFGMYLPPTPPK